MEKILLKTRVKKEEEEEEGDLKIGHTVETG